MFIIELLTKEIDFHMSKMKSALHHYQFYDLNDLRMKKSKYVILSVALKAKKTYLSHSHLIALKFFVLNRSFNMKLSIYSQRLYK